MSDAIREAFEAIEQSVACGDMSAAQVFTQMRQIAMTALQSSQTAPAVPEGLNFGLISAVLEDYANLQTSGVIPCANRYPASDANEQAELLDMLDAPQPDHIGDEKNCNNGQDCDNCEPPNGCKTDHSPDAGKVVWAVIDRDGQIAYSIAPNQDYREEWAISSCHEHINEAIADNITGAAQWVVRPLTVARLRASQQEGSTAGDDGEGG